MRRATALLLLSFGFGCYEDVKLPKAATPVALPRTGFPLDALDRTLGAVVDAEGRVDYEKLRAARGDLERFLQLAAQTSPEKEPGRFRAKSQAITYWLNLYLAATLYGVSERPGLKTIEGVQRELYFFTRYSVGGKEMSLYQMEEALARLQPHDLRLRGLIFCASRDCPPIPQRAIAPEQLKAALEAGARWLCGKDKVQVDKDSKSARVLLSPEFQWFGKDVEAAGGALKFCRSHGREELPLNAELRYRNFDWRLKAQPKGAQP